MGTRLVNRGERLTAIERMLFRNDQGMRAVEIAKACGVDRRTIYRDLAMLEKLGVPFSQRDGRFFLNRDYYLASVRMNFNEAVALFLAARVYTRSAEQQNPYIISALNKLCSALPETVSNHVDLIADWMRGNPIDRNYVQIMETIIRAWVERRSVKLWAGTSRSGDVQTYEFSPYFIEPTTTGGLYVVGMDRAEEAIRALRIEWIKRAKLLEDTYDIPASFDRRPYLESVWGMMASEAQDRVKVVLAFAPDVTPLIRERLWHTSQQIETLVDKRCTLTIHVHDWHEMLPWLRSWGSQVEVLEPTKLRHELAAEAVRVAQVYQQVVAI